MTRKDWDKIEKVIKQCRPINPILGIPDYPSMEWMRRRLALGISEEFELKEGVHDAFMKAAGITPTQERTFK